MLVLGIDPGSTVTGFGLVALERGRYRLRGAGAIRTRSDRPIPERLATIYHGLTQVLAEHEVDEVSIEAIFRHKSSESALRLGQARGVALLAAAQAGKPVFEYNTMTVKQTVGAHGRADKDAVARMVRVLLGEVPLGPADLTDALAIAITHCAHAGRQRLLAASAP